ncbi:unnamed protein product [Urochloa decumbens]|uniref:Sulfotransferase n=1 Tax=Urochloa decumbens TaxID=240449 RepID=A0ABC9E782_9POAL
MAAPANTSGAAAAAVASLLPSRPATPHSDMAEILPSLPLETRCPPFHLRLYKGFWQPEKVLVENIPAINAHFEPRPSDIFLASFPKSGTTWLKSLAFATLNRAVHSPFDVDHPLCRQNPHDCVRFLEAISFDEMEHEPHVLRSSPRVLATHLPYSMLPERIAGDGEGSMGRIVYICREPKDVLVSGWLFTKKTSSALGLDEQSYTLQEAFDLFCEGRCESLRRPGKVLFLKYEEMLREPASNLRKLAEFMGCKFSKEEEDGGLVDAIVELCSLHKLKSMEVNKNGCNSLAVRNEAYFRKGMAGDWSNHLTPEMAQKLDKLVEDALQGSGLDLSLLIV